jgi:carbamoyl-phosphate synthase large subunit
VPKRADLRSVLIIGSGPIRIGQGCEFDYSASQACRVLRREGLRVVLLNSNPATIMTDPEWADATYIEPLDLETLVEVIEAERPDALLPTLGGQTALNLAVELHEAGVLAQYGVELLGADVEAIRRAEDRLAFRDAMVAAGLDVPVSEIVTSGCLESFAPRSRSAAAAGASPGRPRSSTSGSPRASPRAPWGRCSSRSRSKAGRSSSSR